MASVYGSVPIDLTVVCGTVTGSVDVDCRVFGPLTMLTKRNPSDGVIIPT